MGTVTPTPTLVVGLGQAGCRMAAAVNELATEEKIAEYFKVVGIDSDPEDAARALPADSNHLTLEIDNSSWAQEHERVPYLEDRHELRDIGGAVRQRPVGRRYIDNAEGLERTWQFLERQTEEFITGVETSINDTSGAGLNVWVVNSLAGGTGSGAFPLVAGLLNELLAELEAKRHIQTTLRGVGSLLRLDRLAEQVRKPENPPASYLNAYAALSDLQTLLGDEQATVSLHADNSGYVQDELDVGGVLDQYLLVGIQEQQRKYLNSVNKMVADAIYYFGAATAIEDFPNDEEAHPARLFSLDGGELVFPADTADQYLQFREDIASKLEERDQLERDREDRAKELGYLEAVLSLDWDSLPSSNSPVSRELVRRCEDEATGFPQGVSPEDLNTGIEETVATLASNCELDNNYEFDASTVLRYLFLSRLVAEIKQRRNQLRDDLSSFVTTHLNIYKEPLTAYFDESTINALESNPALEAKQLEQFLVDERDRLVEQREASLPLITDFFGDLRADIEEIEMAIDELGMLTSEYNKYRTLNDRVHEDLYESRDKLLNLRREIEDTRYDLDDRIADIEHELETLHRQIDRVKTELSESTVGRHRTTLPVEQPEQLERGMLDRARKDGFITLIEADLVDRDTFQMALEKICSRREEPIQDRNRFSQPYSVLAPILAEENIEEWQDDIAAAAMETGFETVEQSVDSVDTLSMSLLGLYANIDLEATSEFGTLDDYLTDADRDLSELFGAEIESIPGPVAYPEL